jgi:hypothetical protein
VARVELGRARTGPRQPPQRRPAVGDRPSTWRPAPTRSRPRTRCSDTLERGREALPGRAGR